MSRPLLPLLIVGNKNYSSWSLRGWLLLKQFNIEFEEQLIQLFDSLAKPTLKQYSATGKVPVLVINRNNRTDDNQNNPQICVTDSLSIGLFANDYLTDLDIWSGLIKSDIDKDNGLLQKQRAFCQSIVSEMHSSFNGVRNEMPMNVRATAKINPSESCLADLDRIEDIFEQCLQGADLSKQTDCYLFGKFTIADAFYAPVVLRLKTYTEHSGLKLRATTKQYMDVMLSNPYIQDWVKNALQETRIIKENEAGEILSLEGVLGSF